MMLNAGSQAVRRKRRYGPAEILSFVEAHERFLRGDGGCSAILHNVDAHGLDLSGRRLTAADFTGIELDDARLVGADFSQAILAMASLRRVNAQQAIFRAANMCGASLRGGDFSGADFDGADLSRAMVVSHGPDMFRIIPARTDELTFEADFGGCSLRRASLVGARLTGANFSDALLDGSDLQGADLSGCRLNGAVLTGANLAGARVEPSALKVCILDPGPDLIARASVLIERLGEAERWVDTAGAEGAPCVLDGEDLRSLGDALRGRRLTAISAVRVCAVGVSFAGAQLQAGRFDDADLRASDFTGADLRGASFRGAKLKHAIFDGADLRPLSLTNGSARAADLTGADLGVGALDKASVR